MKKRKLISLIACSILSLSLINGTVQAQVTTVPTNTSTIQSNNPQKLIKDDLKSKLEKEGFGYNVRVNSTWTIQSNTCTSYVQ